MVKDKAIIPDYFRKIGRKHKAVVETTSSWYWLCDVLQENKIDIKLAHAKHLKAISGNLSLEGEFSFAKLVCCKKKILKFKLRMIKLR